MSRNDIFTELMDTLYESSRLVNTYESIPRNYGTEDELFMVEVHTLDLIGKSEKITTSEIAIKTDRTTSAVSQIINKLTKKNLVLKYRNQNNYREFLLELTPKGKQVYTYHNQLDEIEYGNNLDLLDQYSDKDFETFIQISKILNKKFKRVLDENLI